MNSIKLEAIGATVNESNKVNWPDLSEHTPDSNCNSNNLWRNIQRMEKQLQKSEETSKDNNDTKQPNCQLKNQRDINKLVKISQSNQRETSNAFNQQANWTGEIWILKHIRWWISSSQGMYRDNQWRGRWSYERADKVNPPTGNADFWYFFRGTDGTGPQERILVDDLPV